MFIYLTDYVGFIIIMIIIALLIAIGFAIISLINHVESEDEDDEG